MSAPVASFKAQLVALGDSGSINLSEHDYEDTALLVFLAPVEEARKAGALFRATVDLHTGPAHEVTQELVALVEAFEGYMLATGASEGDALLVEARRVLKKARGRT